MARCGSQFYNAPLLGGWWFDVPDPDPLPLPRGVHNYAEVEFDVRGIVQLDYQQLGLIDGFHFPRAVTGVPIQRAVRRVHLLYGSETAQPRWPAASYILHYADGHQIEIPILDEPNVRSWEIGEMREPFSPNSCIAWRGHLLERSGDPRIAMLYRRTWDNPTPAVEIDRIDFVAKDYYPFLLGITVE